MSLTLTKTQQRIGCEGPSCSACVALAAFQPAVLAQPSTCALHNSSSIRAIQHECDPANSSLPDLTHPYDHISRSKLFSASLYVNMMVGSNDAPHVSQVLGLEI